MSDLQQTGDELTQHSPDDHRLQLHALAYNLDNIMRTLALPRGTCALMTIKLALSTMKTPFVPVPEVGGVLYLRAATSKLPWKAKVATVMAGVGGHPGNVG